MTTQQDFENYIIHLFVVKRLWESNFSQAEQILDCIRYTDMKKHGGSGGMPPQTFELLRGTIRFVVAKRKALFYLLNKEMRGHLITNKLVPKLYM